MRKLLISLISMIITGVALADNVQTGYVKTCGRMGNDGKVIAGKRLNAATVVIQNGSSVLSDKSGNFILKVPSNKFYLKNIKKSGYIVADPDILSKQYSCSSNPLILVLDEPTVQQDDKLASERKLRRNLQKQLQQREDEIEALKEQNKISDQEKRELLQKLYADQESNEKFIAEMAERYSKIDFDQLDEFQRQIATFIQNGELVRADSLLRTKGSMNEREIKIKKIINANATERSVLNERERILKESIKNTENLIRDFASDCYSYFEISKLKCEKDSAVYWIEKRANLDPSNAEWQLEAGNYLAEYIADYDKAELYYNDILNQVSENKYIPKQILSDCYSGLGIIEYSRGKYDRALHYYHESAISVDNSSNTASAYGNCGAIYLTLGDYDKAEESLNKAIDLLTNEEKVSRNQIASVYNTLGHLKIINGNYHEALEILNKAVELESLEGNCDNTVCSTTFNNIGTVYNNIGEHNEALAYFNKALLIKKQLLGNTHPSLALALYNVGFQYETLGDYQNAISKYKEAKEIISRTLGENNPSMVNIYIAIGGIYKDYFHDNSEALMYMTKAIDISKNVYGTNEHIDIALCYNNIGSILAKEKDFDNGLNHLNKSITIYKAIFGEQHPELITPYLNIGELYADMKDFSMAKSYVESALQISENLVGEIHPLTASCYNNLGGIYSNCGDYSNALKFYKKAIEVLTQVFGDNHVHIAKANINIGKLFYNQGEFDQAYNYYYNAYKIQREILGAEHDEVKATEKLLEELKR